MALDLNSVDLSAVEALAAIKSEQDQLGERLKTMESKRSQVSAEVYQRVHSDYRKRQAELMSQAAPLIQKAGESYRALRMELIELESAFKTAQLDREEVDFRHALGEFDEKELANRVKAVDARIATIGDAPTRCLHPGDSGLAGIFHVDRNLGLAVARRHEAAFDGEGTDTGEDVAAVLRVGDDRLVDEDLQEQIVDIDSLALGLLHHRDLGGQRIGPSHAIDLARIGRRDGN